MRSISHRNHKKSQTGLELLMFFSIAMLIFSAVYTSIFDKTKDVYDSKSRSEALKISEKIASEINTAVSEGDGYSKNITLSNNVFGTGYVVFIEKGDVFVRWREKNAVSRTITENVTGTFVAGNNQIMNKGGVIFVN